jgi:nitrilase
MTLAAAVQMNSSADVAANLASARTLLEQAAEAGAKLAALPENFVIMGRTETDKLAVAEPFDPSLRSGAVQSWLRQTARDLGLWIVAGTLPLKLANETRVAPACLVVSDTGECVARYDKMHLFDVDLPKAEESYRESATFAPGSQTQWVDTPIGRLGLAICYDMRFPELFRLLAAQGVEVFCVPAAFTVPTGRAHWEVLLRARAVENLCYVLAPAQAGMHANGRETYGHSLIVHPWGEVLACRPEGAGIVTADIDRSQIAELRQRFPALSHRRL